MNTQGQIVDRKDYGREFVLLASLFLILVGIKFYVILAYGNITPYWDQWDAEAELLYKPFHEGTLYWHNLLAPHNEHRIFMTRLLALGLLILNGSWNPLLQMVVNAVLHVGTLITLLVFLIAVIGRRYAPLLTAFSGILFGVPFGWENTLAGFQSQFYFVILFSVVSLYFTTVNPPCPAPGYWD